MKPSGCVISTPRVPINSDKLTRPWRSTGPKYGVQLSAAKLSAEGFQAKSYGVNFWRNFFGHAIEALRVSANEHKI